MTINRRRFLQSSVGAALAGAMHSAAWAQSYPARPVKLLVPYAAGGPTDILARITAQKLSDQLGKPFIVENASGAGGNIGMGRGAKAAPDGHTILIVPPNIVVNPALYGSVPYDPYKDFDPVTIAVRAPVVLIVHPSVGARTVKELVSLIRANPGKYHFASPGAGTPPHLVGEQFRLSLSLDLVHVPFNSGGQAVASTLAGHTLIAFTSTPPAVQHVKEGKLQALAVTSRLRSSALPTVPTMLEEGYPDIAGEGWFAFIVPAGTPASVTSLLHREIVKVIALPDISDRLATLGFEPVGSTPEESVLLFRTEGAKWSKLIRDAGIKAE